MRYIVSDVRTRSYGFGFWQDDECAFQEAHEPVNRHREICNADREAVKADMKDGVMNTSVSAVSEGADSFCISPGSDSDSSDCLYSADAGERSIGV